MMKRARWIFAGVVLFVLLIILAGVSLITTTEYWDGSFPQTEFQVTFQDTSGKPLTGVQLHVEDQNGDSCFGYPVTDYFPVSTPESDERGIITFHHVSLGLEYGGRCSHLYWLIPVGNCDAPRYVCRFFHGNHEIFHIYFDELISICETSHDQVDRQWDWMRCSVSGLDAPAVSEELLFRSDIPDKEAHGVSRLEKWAVRNARVDILTRRDQLKKETGDIREQLAFTLCQVEKQVTLQDGEKLSSGN